MNKKLLLILSLLFIVALFGCDFFGSNSGTRKSSETVSSNVMSDSSGQSCACNDSLNLIEPGQYVKAYVNSNIKNKISNITDLEDKVKKIIEVFNDKDKRCT